MDSFVLGLDRALFRRLFDAECGVGEEGIRGDDGGMGGDEGGSDQEIEGGRVKFDSGEQTDECERGGVCSCDRDFGLDGVSIISLVAGFLGGFFFGGGSGGSIISMSLSLSLLSLPEKSESSGSEFCGFGFDLRLRLLGGLGTARSAAIASVIRV